MARRETDSLSTLLKSLDIQQPRAAIRQIDAYALQLDTKTDAPLLRDLSLLMRQLSVLVVNALLKEEAVFMNERYHSELSCHTVERSFFHDCDRRWTEPGPIQDEIDSIRTRLLRAVEKA